MQLAYVFGNPGKKPKKAKKGLGAPKKTSKLKVGGKLVKKKKKKKLKGKAKAAFLARMAKGRKKHGKKAKKAHKKAHKTRGKKRGKKNPYSYVATRPQVVAQSKWATSEKERREMWDKVGMIGEKIAGLDKKLKLIDSKSEGGKRKIRSIKALVSKDAKKRKNLQSLLKMEVKKQQKVEKQRAALEKIPGTTIVKIEKKVKQNPRKKGKKKMAKKRKSGSKKAARRRKHRALLTKTIHVPKRRRTLRVRINPSLKDLVSEYGPVTVAGLALPLWELALKKSVSMLDRAAGGMITKVVGPIDAQVPGVSTPLVSFLALEGLKWMDKNYLKGALQTDKGMVKKAIDTAQVVNAAQVGVLVSQKMIVPTAAKMVGMSGADFGVIPQGLGAGADFGRTQADFGNVEYFPNRAMGEVQYIPEGESIENHGIGDLVDDEEQMGVVPAGLGLIPEGMGDGQMG